VRRVLVLCILATVASSGCVHRVTEVRSVPVTPEPCGIPRLPDIEVEFAECDAPPESGIEGKLACTSPAGYAAIAAWTRAAEELLTRLESCPYVRYGADLREALKGDPYMKP
jgi:hypothetical protein